MSHQDQHTRLPFKKSFIRAQIVSLSATTIDFTMSIFCHHLLGIYYVTATTIGSFFGAVTSFLLGRNWAFYNKKGRVTVQALRFLIISAFSIFTNTTGVYFFKENFDLTFITSRVVTAILVGVFFNFFMNRYFVFR